MVIQSGNIQLPASLCAPGWVQPGTMQGLSLCEGGGGAVEGKRAWFPVLLFLPGASARVVIDRVDAPPPGKHLPSPWKVEGGRWCASLLLPIRPLVT